MSIRDDSLGAWFEREILPHDEGLTRFLLRICGAGDELADLRQKAYARVYEAAGKVKPRSPKAFLFATARHVATDRFRRARTVTFYTGATEEVFTQLVDELSPEHQAAAHGELQELSRAFECLTPRSREVLWLRRVQEYCSERRRNVLGVGEGRGETHDSGAAAAGGVDALLAVDTVA
jgi:RNA polymerase sigma factor (sigma-70 family)